MITIVHDHSINARYARCDMKSEHRKITYALGILKPRYPVPAIRGWNYITMPNGGGVKNDVAMVGARYLDWSRGALEIY